MELNDVFVDDKPSEVGPVKAGPLAAVVEEITHELENLSVAEDDDVAEKQSMTRRLITSYCELTAKGRQLVNKHIEVVLFDLTTKGFDVNALCDVGKRRTALHVIAQTPDSGRFIRALHAAGAKSNAVDYRLQTPLHLSVAYGDVTNSQTLIECGANVNQQDISQQTPLHLSASGRRHNSVMQHLIRCRADVGLVDAGLQTALHVAARSARHELVRILVNQGKAHVNRQDSAGCTPLHLAAKYDISGNVIRELLTRRSADVNVHDAVALETPLHNALRYNMVENVQLLLNVGSDVNRADINGDTSVHFAARYLTDISLWRTILSNSSVDVIKCNSFGVTARQMAEKSNNPVARVMIEQHWALHHE